jgi:CHAT domain-containing protein
LLNIGQIYVALGQCTEALEVYQQALAISLEIGDRLSEAIILNNIAGLIGGTTTGNCSVNLLNVEEALEIYEKTLTIQRELGDRSGEAITLNNIGVIYQRQENYSQAIDYFRQALLITMEIGDKDGEGEILSNIGAVLIQQNQPELASVFYKQSVNVRETIRESLQTLPKEAQQTYTDTVADTYRRLADLLLQQGRIPEAQQVLDLLKIEELSEFAHTTRATWTGRDLAYTDPEQAVIAAHGSLIALGGQLTTCETTNCAQLETLYSQLEALKRQYEDQVTEFEATIRANRADDEIFQNPGNISGEAEALLAAYAEDGQKAVLIYPFVLEDKLWLVWATAGNVVGSVEVPVPQGELSIAVQRFGELLQNPQAGSLADLQATSQQLYSWIIEPLDAELAKNDIDHLIFVNDRSCQHMPRVFPAFVMLWLPLWVQRLFF